MTGTDSLTSLIIHTDGGARGNPGPAAVGIVIYTDQKETLHQFSRYLGSTTNNQAEYQAVIEALTYLSVNRASFPGLRSLSFYLDSELVVKQLNGLYRVKQPELQVLNHQVKQLLADLKVSAEFIHVRRQFNQVADRLLNEELDRHA